MVIGRDGSGSVRALIVEDEPLAMDNFRIAMRGHAEIEVVGEARDGAEAVDLVGELDPDLLFLDVHLPDMDGFQVLQELDQEKLPEVVFVTAFDQHALRAFEVHAIDYLLKPLDDARLAECVRRAVAQLQRRRAGTVRRSVEALLTTIREHPQLAPAALDRPVERILVRNDGKILPLEVSDIDWMEAAGNYVRVHTRDEQQHLIRSSLSEMEERLDPARFARIHRSTVVNIARIRELEPWVGGDYTATLTSGRELRVSRTYRDALLDTLE